jgi:hypothetical protein
VIVQLSKDAVSGVARFAAPITSPPTTRGTATNACGAVTASVEGVVIARPYQPPVLSVVALLPAGDIDVVMGEGGEKLQPGGRSIRLVAGKRSVCRLDWQVP